jgi:hypothetical protein
MQSENKSFSGYTDFEGLRFPRHLELHVNGSRVLSAEITSLAQTDFDEKLLTPPHGSIERRDCENIKPAVPIKTTDPNFSGSNTIMGDTRVALTILADGSVGDVQPIGGASAAMDAEMVRTLKGWRFQPAMCGNDPVVSDIFIVVSVQQH